MATKAQNARQPYGLTDELVDSLLNGSTTHEEVFGENGIYRQLTKRLFERMLETEMNHHLGYEKYQKPEHEQRLLDGGNARNGSSSKSLKTAHSEVEPSIPRDRQGRSQAEDYSQRHNPIAGDRTNDSNALWRWDVHA